VVEKADHKRREHLRARDERWDREHHARGHSHEHAGGHVAIRTGRIEAHEPQQAEHAGRAEQHRHAVAHHVRKHGEEERAAQAVAFANALEARVRRGQHVHQGGPVTREHAAVALLPRERLTDPRATRLTESLIGPLEAGLARVRATTRTGGAPRVAVGVNRAPGRALEPVLQRVDGRLVAHAASVLA
jgi:hypothetical protein